MPRLFNLRLAEQSRCNISHVCFFELVVLPVVSVDVDVLECIDHAIDIEAHVHKSINKVLVIPLVSAPLLELSKYLLEEPLPSQFLLPRTLSFWFRRCGGMWYTAGPVDGPRCVCMLDSPLSCHMLELDGIVHQHARYLRILRVFGFWRAEEGL